MQKRYTREEFEKIPLDKPSEPGGNFRFFQNEVWHVFDATKCEAYDAVFDEPPAPPVKTQNDKIAALEADVASLLKRVSDLEDGLGVQKPKSSKAA